ncbi:kinase-like domain-containing protein [Pyrenochaeta sp. MPI-SDFR-AT-0127]|nr:kinase-like domain-containing protein [Pyrenochaeta sp. MPI-SDFR-AT-0127]
MIESKGLLVTGIVIAIFKTLLKQLEAFEQGIDEDDEDALTSLTTVKRSVALQRNIFEDTTAEIMCDVLPEKETIGAFFNAPEDKKWTEQGILARANERLGVYAESYWSSCVTIHNSLIDIKLLADDVEIWEQTSADASNYESPEWDALVRKLWGENNLLILKDLEKNNQTLKTTLYNVYQWHNLGIQEVSTALTRVLDFTQSSKLAETETQLKEICSRVQQDEESLLQLLEESAATVRPSLQICSSGNTYCVAGSRTSYESRELLRLRWLLVHLPSPDHFKPQKCLHFMECQYVEINEYPCLAKLERAWYDNRNAWCKEAFSGSIGTVTGLMWPAEFEEGADLTCLKEHKWRILETGNAVLDAVSYKGVVLVRKVMKWNTPDDYDEIQEERENLQRLHHYHIIQLFGVYKKPETFAMLLYPLCEYNLETFMEQCQAENAENILLKPECLLKRLYLESFFPCLAQALRFIHSHTTRHSDIKPANIVIKERIRDASRGRQYHIYIADFGSSSRFDVNSQTERYVAKTLKYCAPEVAPNQASNFADETKWGRAADVFSLGCVYAEMLTVLACRRIMNFDSFREGTMSLDGEALKRSKKVLKDKSFQRNLQRVKDWMQSLRNYEEDAYAKIKPMPRGYWYRRGDRVAFAPWRTTFAQTIDIAESMIQDDQHARPRIIEVVKRLEVNDCCNHETIPLYTLFDNSAARAQPPGSSTP